MIEQARGFRKEHEASLAAARKMIPITDLTAEELAEMRDVYQPYVIGKAYAVNDIFRTNDQLFKVIQAHTSQADWLPAQTPALYLLIQPSGVIPEWVQPTGAHDAYKKGDLILFEGKTYKSLIDANTYSPADYPDGWELQP